MGGGSVPGPETGQQNRQVTGVAPTGGGGVQGPVAASDGVQQDLRITGWPRTVEWAEFRDLTARPAGENEDAQINPVTEGGDARTVRERGQWKLAELELKVVVNLDDSWVVQSKKSDALKAHEQGHFDIHGLIAGRDMLEALRLLRERSSDRLGRSVERVMERHRQRAQRMSDAYDDDTEHGLNAVRQAAWERRIQNAIDNNSSLRAPD
jgi:hypothetical protein